LTYFVNGFTIKLIKKAEENMTVEQAAQQLGKTPRQIYYAIAINKIKPKKINENYWITPSQLKKLENK